MLNQLRRKIMLMNTLLKSAITLIILSIIIMLLSGCRVVVEKPSNPEILLIPASPGPGHIYINDSWKWNSRASAYKVSPGYWTKSKKNAVWIDGHWRKTRAGWRYSKGHWG